MYQEFAEEQVYGQEKTVYDRIDFTKESQEYMNIDDLARLYMVLYEKKHGEFSSYFPIILSVVNEKLIEAKVITVKLDPYVLMDYINLFRYKENINPVLYILSYIITDGKSTIKEDSLKRILRNWSNLPYKNISDISLIRYIRWWISTTGNTSLNWTI